MTPPPAGPAPIVAPPSPAHVVASRRGKIAALRAKVNRSPAEERALLEAVVDELLGVPGG